MVDDIIILDEILDGLNGEHPELDGEVEVHQKLSMPRNEWLIRFIGVEGSVWEWTITARSAV